MVCAVHQHALAEEAHYYPAVPDAFAELAAVRGAFETEACPPAGNLAAGVGTGWIGRPSGQTVVGAAQRTAAGVSGQTEVAAAEQIDPGQIAAVAVERTVQVCAS